MKPRTGCLFLFISLGGCAATWDAQRAFAGGAGKLTISLVNSVPPTMVWTNVAVSIDANPIYAESGALPKTLVSGELRPHPGNHVVLVEATYMDGALVYEGYARSERKGFVYVFRDSQEIPTAAGKTTALRVELYQDPTPGSPRPLRTRFRIEMDGAEVVLPITPTTPNP